MPNFIGQPCTSCHNTITAGDDIVVCPDCGSPYHRECYIKEGSCINTELHEKGESWKPVNTQPEPSPNAAAAPTMVACKNCGTENSSEEPFCKNCGAPINMEKAAGAIFERSVNDGMSDSNPQSFSPFGGFVQVNRFDNSSDIDGITIGEYNGYIGQRWFYFLPKFMRFSKIKSKISFNFSAFLFPHLYFFYRKMIPIGILMLIATSVLSLPSVLVYMIRFGYLPSVTFINTQWFTNIVNASSIISYLIQIVAGIFANWLYYRQAKTDIQKIKTTVYDETAKKIAIANAGGTSWPYTIAAVLAMTAITMLLFFIFYKAIGI